MQDFDLPSQYSDRVVGGYSIDVSTWPTPDEGALNGDTRSSYFARKSAVTLYLQGYPAVHIKEHTGLGAKQAYRLIRERCLETHQDGQPYGWRGLVPYFRIHAYKRRTKIQIDSSGCGGAGAMDAVLDTHPQLRLALEKRIKYVSAGINLEETKLTVNRHCIWFLDQLRRLGYERRNEWPFNTTSMAYYSVRRYMIKILSSHPRVLAAVSGGSEAVRKLKSGDGSGRPVTRFLQRVEMDAHKLDGRFIVCVPEIGGGTSERIIHRLWVIVIIDVVSRLVLGYYFSMNREVSSDDVLRAIKSALVKWHRRSISFSEEPYRENAGYLSSISDEFIGLCWDETSVDGALAETCVRVNSALRDVVGAVLLTPSNSYAKRRSLDDRPFIETFFRTIAERGFQRLTNTTGGNTSERKGRDPDQVAITSRFQYEYAEELLDVLIANYNAAPHAGIGKRSPLNYAKFLYETSEGMFRRADQNTVESLLSVRKLCKVRGGAKTGRSVYVECFYARYSNDILQNRQDLVGNSIWIVHHKEDDARIALASTQDGTSLGVLRASPPWHISPHSLALRKIIHQSQLKGKFQIAPGADGIETFLNFVESQPAKKLPIHPAYLEARRILASAADQFIGDSMLQAAQERMRNDVPQQEKVSASNRSDEANHQKQGKSSTKNKSKDCSPMPPRRIAATRS